MHVLLTPALRALAKPMLYAASLLSRNIGHIVAGEWQHDNAACNGSMSEKSLTVHGNSVASAKLEPRRKNDVADKSITWLRPSFRFTASKPDIQPRAASLFFSVSLFLVTLEVFVAVRVWLLPIAVVRLVIDGEDVLHAHQVGHRALEHLAFCFKRLHFLSRATLKELAATL
jgi:hypothetical protein